MTVVVRGPDDRVAGAAARVGGDDVAPAARRRLRRVLGGAAVVADESVPHRPALRDVEDAVGDAVQAHVGDGLAAAAASAELPAGEHRDRAEDRRAAARQGVAHGAAVAEAHGEALARCRRRDRPPPAP